MVGADDLAGVDRLNKASAAVLGMSDRDNVYGLFRVGHYRPGISPRNGLGTLTERNGRKDEGERKGCKDTTQR